MKNFRFLIFFLLIISCESTNNQDSDWSTVDRKIREKDSTNAAKLARKVPGAIQEFSAYPDIKKDSVRDSLQKDTDPNL